MKAKLEEQIQQKLSTMAQRKMQEFESAKQMIQRDKDKFAQIKCLEKQKKDNTREVLSNTYDAQKAHKTTKDMEEKLKKIDISLRKLPNKYQDDNEIASIRSNQDGKGMVTNKLSQNANERRNYSKSPEVYSKYNFRVRSRPGSQQSNLGKSVDYASSKNRRDDIEGASNSNIYDQIKKERYIATAKIPGQIIKMINQNKQVSKVENTNNPDGMFTDFYARDASRKQMAKMTQDYLLNDIQRRKHEKELSQRSNSLNAKNCIDQKVDAFRRQVQEENNYKQKNTLNLVKTLSKQIHEKEYKDNQRFAMSEAVKKMNSKNLDAYNGSSETELFESVPGWGKNIKVNPDSDFKKVYSDIHYLNKMHSMDYPDNVIKHDPTRKNSQQSPEPHAKKYTDITSKNIRSNDYDLVPRLERNIKSPDAAYRKKFTDIHTHHRVNRMEWYQD